MNVLKIALQDMRHEAMHFTCAVIVIAAIIGPFLVLLGIKTGAITVLMGKLRDDPANLEVIIKGAHTFTADDVLALRRRADIAFAAGQDLVTTTGRLQLRLAPDGDRNVSGAYAVTGPGDPLAPAGIELNNDSVLLSSAFARRLNAPAGSQLYLSLERGRPFPDRIQRTLHVEAVLGEDRVSGNVVLLTPHTLSLVEAYGFGHAIPDWGVTKGTDLAFRNDQFEKIRIYATGVEDLPALARTIEQELGVQTSSKAREVHEILQLQKNLTAALGFVTAAGVIGLFFVLAAHFWSAVRRKRLTWSMLCLMGTSPLQLCAIPVTQATVVSVVGFGGGLLVYAGAHQSINAWFGPLLQAGESVAILGFIQAALVGLVIFAISVLASMAACYSVLRTDPAEIIRHA